MDLYSTDLNVGLECFTLALILMMISVKWFRVSLPLDFRRANFREVSTAGGLCIFASYLAINLLNGHPVPLQWWLPSIILVASGGIDDYFELRPRYKFMIQVAVVGLFLALRNGEQILVLNAMGLPNAVALGLSAFWILGIITAINMIDGSDWTASVISLGALVCVGFLGADPLPVFAVGGALLAFLCLNRPPARIFLGESGSSWLGFWLAGQFCFVHTISIPPVAQFLVALCAFSIAEIDALLAIARRMRKGVSISQGDRGHIHHRLQNLGIQRWPLALYFLIYQTFVVVGAYSVVRLSSGWEFVLPVASLTAFGILQLYFINMAEGRMIASLEQNGEFAIGHSTEAEKPGFAPWYVIDLRPCYYALAPGERDQTTAFFLDLKIALVGLEPLVSWRTEGNLLVVAKHARLPAAKLEQALLPVFENPHLRVDGGFGGLLRPTMVAPRARYSVFTKSGLSIQSDNQLAFLNEAA